MVLPAGRRAVLRIQGGRGRARHPDPRRRDFTCRRRLYAAHAGQRRPGHRAQAVAARGRCADVVLRVPATTSCTKSSTWSTSSRTSVTCSSASTATTAMRTASNLRSITRPMQGRRRTSPDAGIEHARAHTPRPSFRRDWPDSPASMVMPASADPPRRRTLVGSGRRRRFRDLVKTWDPQVPDREDYAGFGAGGAEHCARMFSEWLAPATRWSWIACSTTGWQAQTCCDYPRHYAGIGTVPEPAAIQL